ncbi:hypothetical protein [Gymnodinialimonas ceratoperidinii]|uniref:Uncharacterized protein n=1 Tax=Gymnodinialimonas ceratoperidinii TaxID=2856823 RepID=A0A8F6YAH5_9RHOB|nr:hypothetical protein [Gymnodinialimonas ceratoperidinii]QXT39578.1 hypothetical protein KYE46_16925 [Gymnodinialimonas ceratoperidinii]
MSRVLSLLPFVRVLVLVLGVAGPLALMGFRGERIDLQLAVAVCAGIAAGASVVVGPLFLRVVAIVAAIAALGAQAAVLFGPESPWGVETAPVLWAIQAALLAGLAYLVWWNQHRLLGG